MNGITSPKHTEEMRNFLLETYDEYEHFKHAILEFVITKWNCDMDSSLSSSVVRLKKSESHYPALEVTLKHVEDRYSDPYLSSRTIYQIKVFTEKNVLFYKHLKQHLKEAVVSYISHYLSFQITNDELETIMERIEFEWSDDGKTGFLTVGLKTWYDLMYSPENLF